jgi:hypothetical protein
MGETTITVTGGGVRIRDLEIRRQHVADFLGSFPEEDHEAIFIQAIEVGTFCLERTRSSLDTEFLRRQLESLMAGVEKAVRSIPEKTRDALVAKIGTNEGQVLRPIETLINEASNTMCDRLKDVRDLLTQEIDPARETGTLGRALKKIHELVDAKRTDSVQGLIGVSIDRVTAEDGALAKAVKAVVASAVEPLVKEVNRLALEVRGQAAAEEALAQTIQKGASFEDEVVERIREWAQLVGGEVHHVGVDNKPGDVVVQIRSMSLPLAPIRIVVEARDRQTALGRKAISNLLKEAIAERGANAGIFVSRSRGGLANEIGDWAEGECDLGSFVACMHGHLITALRFLIVQSRLTALRGAELEVDSACIKNQLQRIRTTLDRIKTINRKVTEVRGSVNDIQTEAETLRDDIRSSLSIIEDAIRAISTEAVVSEAA